jgi:diguanylate cyclase (GGDEF)-like protein/PAS domain S-box-containing protein
VVLSFGAFLALFGWAEYSNWKTQVGRVEATLEQTAEAITQHADDVVEMSRLPLASLISKIEENDGEGDLGQAIEALMKRQLSASPTLDTLSYIDAAGRMVATSSGKYPAGTSYQDRDYFKFHKASPFPLAVLGKPILSRLTHAWVLPITQKVILPDGTFGGVVISTIKVNHFVNFFSRYDIGSDASFLLVRGDGAVLARAPMNDSILGQDISDSDLFTHVRQTRVGAFHYQSPVDQTARAGGFHQSRLTGLVALAAASEWQVLISWAATASVRWIYAAILLVVAGFATVYWRRQMQLRQEREVLAAAREAEFRLLAESSSDLITRFDENGIREYVSPSSVAILGIDPKVLVGHSIFAGMTEDTEILVRQATARLGSGSGHEKFLIRHVKPDGEEVWLETAMSRLPASHPAEAPRVMAITRDVSRHKRAQDELDLLANTDDLTLLANRRFFNARFEAMVTAANRSMTPLSLLMIDADRFKLFNDTYGHAAGDDCLRAIAQVVRNTVTCPDDVCARYGGEEIAVLLAATDAEAAQAIAESIRVGVETIGLEHSRNPPSNHATISIGLATLTPGGHDPAATSQSLFKRADEALYNAKAAGRNRVEMAV